VGRSRKGRPIVATTIGAGPVTLVVVPGVHGDEPLGPRLARRWAATVVARPPRGIRVVIIEAANPDGLSRKQKDNAAGVDLNRNFPSRNWGTKTKPGYDPGPVPASEPETKALLALIQRFMRAQSPRHTPSRMKSTLFILTLHEPFGFVNFDGPARMWARAIAHANGYAVKASVGYPTPGSLGTYFGIERRIPVVTLECAREPASAAWRRHKPALDAALTFVAGRAGVSPRQTAPRNRLRTA
jgi:protein MpaA